MIKHYVLKPIVTGFVGFTTHWTCPCKSMKTIKIILPFILLFIVQVACISHELHELDIQISLHQDGSATIREIRHYMVNEGVEKGFIRFFRKEGIEVTKAEVKEAAATYRIEKSWDENWAAADTGYSNKLVMTTEGQKIYWPLKQMGIFIYMISYEIKGLVHRYSDYDGFCYCLYEAYDVPAEQATVSLSIDGKSLSRYNSRLWTFGHDGKKGFKNDSMFATTTKQMKEDESIILMAQFDKGLLSAVPAVEGSFVEKVKRVALQNSSYVRGASSVTYDEELDSGQSSHYGGVIYERPDYKHDADTITNNIIEEERGVIYDVVVFFIGLVEKIVALPNILKFILLFLVLLVLAVLSVLIDIIKDRLIKSDRPIVRRMIMTTDNMQASPFYRFFRSTPFGLIFKLTIGLIGLLYFFTIGSGVSSLMALILFFIVLGIIIVKIARNHGYLGGKRDSTDDNQSDGNWM